MQSIITYEKLSELLGKSRTDQGKSQKYMAKALGKSLSTIQNWEYGLSRPDLIELLDWFRVLGLNPLRYILDFLHPEVFDNLPPDASESRIHLALDKYIGDIATEPEIRKLAFSIFGRTGSSWHSQLDMICALNHLPIIDRVNIAESVLNLYKMRESRNELRCPDEIKPNLEELETAIEKCKQSVYEGKEDYTN